MKKILIITASLLISLNSLYSQSWQWTKQAGGLSSDIGQSIAVDSLGNQYIAGPFFGKANFGETELTPSGSYDIFIAKLDASGNFLWAKRAGGTGFDIATSVAVDKMGNCYVAGAFSQIAQFGAVPLLTSSGYYDVFVTKISSNGEFVWAKKAGGVEDEQANAVTVDNSGNVYIAGSFKDKSIFGSTELTASGENTDLFVAKLDYNGNFIYAKKAGGADDDQATSIGTDSLGNLYVTGSFMSTAQFGDISLTSNGTYDAFVAKIGQNGDFSYVKKAGGNGDDFGQSIAVDAAGNQYLLGSFQNNLTVNSTTLTADGYSDILIAKLDNTGNFIYAKRAGGSGEDYGFSNVVDKYGNRYLTGNFEQIAHIGSFELTSAGLWDVYIAKLNPDGDCLSALRAGGSGDDIGNGIGIDKQGNAYTTGSFRTVAQFGETALTPYGSDDIFVTKTSYTNSISEDKKVLSCDLVSVYPNPFNPATTISYQLTMDNATMLSVYNAKGELVKSLVNGMQNAGSHSVSFDGSGLNSGVYFVKLVAGNSALNQKILMVK